MKIKRTRLASLVTVGGLAVLGGVGLGAAQGDPAAPTVSANTQPLVTEIDTSQAHGLGILRRDQRADDAIATKLKGPFGANLNLAREVTGDAGDVRVVPANADHLCLRSEDSVGSVWGCTTTDLALSGQLLLSLRTPGESSVPFYGVVPDGVKSVTLVDANGRHALGVTDNVYMGVGIDPSSVEYGTGSATETVRVP